MALFFLDSSALLKLYLAETGSIWLHSYTASNQIVISELALFECSSVLRRRYVEGEFSRDVGLALLAQIVADSRIYRIVPLGGEPQLTRLTELSFNLSPVLRLRALDALHMVGAQIALEAANALTPPEPLIFVSSDLQLLNVAQNQGFTTENPEDHP